MKKTQLALAAVALVASSAAMANGVTIYGIADVGIASTSGKTGFYGDGNNGTTLIGIRGSEDLGGGLTAGFNLESGLNYNAGATGANGGGNGNLFNRAANVSLSTENLGLTLGNQFANDVLATFVYGATAVGGDGVNVPAMVRLFGGIPGAVAQTSGGLNLADGTSPITANNTIFFVPEAAQLSFSVAGLKGNVMTRGTQKSATESTYNAATLGGSFGGVNAAIGHKSAGFDASSDNHRTTFVAANTSFGDIRINGAYANNSGLVSGSTYVVGASMPLVAGISAGLTYAKGISGQGNMTAGSLQYDLSKRTLGYLNYASFSEAGGGSGTVALTGNTGFAVTGKSLLTVGIKHSF